MTFSGRVSSWSWGSTDGTSMWTLVGTSTGGRTGEGRGERGGGGSNEYV